MLSLIYLGIYSSSSSKIVVNCPRRRCKDNTYQQHSLERYYYETIPTAPISTNMDLETQGESPNNPSTCDAMQASAVLPPHCRLLDRLKRLGYNSQGAGGKESYCDFHIHLLRHLRARLPI